MLSYLNFRCYFEGNDPNHIHFLLKALLPAIFIAIKKNCLWPLKQPFLERPGNFSGPKANLKITTVLHINSSTVPSSKLVASLTIVSSRTIFKLERLS